MFPNAFEAQKHNVPLAIATGGDPALHHMERYCNSRDGHFPFPRDALRALARRSRRST
jgi:hypothetical protein